MNKNYSNEGVLLTVDEVAELLRTSKRAIYTMNARGQIKGARKIGRRLLFLRDTLMAWISGNDTTRNGGRS